MSKRVWPGDRAPEAARAQYWLDMQRDWIEQCGGSLSGYIHRYHEQSFYTVEDAKAIYQADLAELRRVQERYDAAVEANQRLIRKVVDRGKS